jgi:Carboxypeptidase regulatory-like domain/Bacterial Ig-like domain (group 2)
MARLTRTSLTRFAILFAILLSACVDAPNAPEDGFAVGALVFAPSFALVGPRGPAMSPAQADALNEAFDRVNRFRLVIRRVSNNEIVADTIISVTPGQDQYDLAVPVLAVTADEQFVVALTAFEGEQELFSAPAIPVTATRVDGAGNPVGAAPATTNVELTYSGPGATATSVEVSPTALVLAPGDDATLASKVLAEDGSVVAGVPISWTSTAESVATVSDEGEVSGSSDGIAEIVFATPTGLEARATVYVVSGMLAYVEGGVVMSRAAAGGDAESRGGTGGARAPAWSPDGGGLFYAEGGSVRRAGQDSPLFDGGWPSVSPDGMTLAAENAGTVVFANLDGSNPTAGPSGTTPVWSGAGELVVGGGSVQRVRADGSGRSDIVPGSAALPALGPGGEVAYVQDGTLMAGGGPLATGVSGRPSWDPTGFWLAAPTGAGMMLVPVDGSAPPVALPGLGGATDPAFRPNRPLLAPASLNLTGTDPDPPVPGQRVTLLGGGFDWIIPSNNQIFWPAAEGAEESTVTSAAPTALTTTMPRSVLAGQIRVQNRSGTAVLDFEPQLGAVEVHAMTRDGTAVPDVEGVILDADGGEVARDLTDQNGEILFPGLVPGQYTLNLTAPEGFALKGAASRVLDVTAAALVVDVRLTPRVARLEISPGLPSVAVGERITVTAAAFDSNGRPIADFERSFWGAGTSHVAAGGAGLSGVLGGTHPTPGEGDALFNIGLNDQVFSFAATVTSHIEGTVSRPAPQPVDGPSPVGVQPVPSVSVKVTRDGVVVGSTATNQNGAFRVDGLLAGSYTVDVNAPGDANDPSVTVVLDQGNPIGVLSIVLSSGGDRRAGDIAIYKDYDPWFGEAKNETTLQAAPFNFVLGTDYFVRPTSDLAAGIPSQTSLIIIGSASDGDQPIIGVNNPTAQANLDAWVSGGGWLLAHLGDNSFQSYEIPGLSGSADDASGCTGETLTLADHPFYRGPDGLLGTGDDLDDSNIDNGGRFCSDNHGSLAGILPEGAEILMIEQGNLQRPTYATYAYGAGRVVVTTLTIEFGPHSQQTLTNHLWWTIMSGSAPAPVSPPDLAPPSLSPRRFLLAPRGALPRTDRRPGGGN